ncbi:hypothetical protein IQ272_14460 [Chroococcidiopsidales cyanobacterium LEGE 13417]|uniref:hypothetical protein n=1 Tax=Chroococcidiopsis sp. CCALA 051 TaxID=869949 RepID=UPI0018ED1535|nr:hypothetical protein [Chroococcidiopsis sp. CCALA 051]MBE9017315.1 hypothetical protein [Chroococcidiopsidales cyanobacterium LEGE 13417]
MIDYNLSLSQFVEVNDKVTRRPIQDILADLAVARQEREWADKDLALGIGKIESTIQSN